RQLVAGRGPVDDEAVEGRLAVLRLHRDGPLQLRSRRVGVEAQIDGVVRAEDDVSAGIMDGDAHAERLADPDVFRLLPELQVGRVAHDDVDLLAMGLLKAGGGGAHVMLAGLMNDDLGEGRDALDGLLRIGGVVADVEGDLPVEIHHAIALGIPGLDLDGGPEGTPRLAGGGHLDEAELLAATGNELDHRALRDGQRVDEDGNHTGPHLLAGDPDLRDAVPVRPRRLDADLVGGLGRARLDRAVGHGPAALVACHDPNDGGIAAVGRNALRPDQLDEGHRRIGLAGSRILRAPVVAACRKEQSDQPKRPDCALHECPVSGFRATGTWPGGNTSRAVERRDPRWPDQTSDRARKSTLRWSDPKGLSPGSEGIWLPKRGLATTRCDF